MSWTPTVIFWGVIVRYPLKHPYRMKHNSLLSSSIFPSSPFILFFSFSFLISPLLPQPSLSLYWWNMILNFKPTWSVSNFFPGYIPCIGMKLSIPPPILFTFSSIFLNTLIIFILKSLSASYHWLDYVQFSSTVCCFPVDNCVSLLYYVRPYA